MIHSFPELAAITIETTVFRVEVVSLASVSADLAAELRQPVLSGGRCKAARNTNQYRLFVVRGAEGVHTDSLYRKNYSCKIRPSQRSFVRRKDRSCCDIIKVELPLDA